MDPRLFRFAVRGCLFCLALGVLVVPAAVGIRTFQRRHEPRTALLNGVDPGAYTVALLGDSAFCSFYVNNEADALWSQLETLTGQACFPGALNGAKGGDFLDAAEVLARRLPAASVVFIDIVPTRLMWNAGSHGRNYALSAVLTERASGLQACFDDLRVDYLKYAILFLKKDRQKIERKGGYERVWDRDGDFARDRYQMMLSWACWSDPEGVRRKAAENIGFLGELDRVFRGRGIRAVFVLTPLNRQQIRTYSSELVAGNVCSLLDGMREMTKAYLRDIGASCIDLFDACPPEGFADVLHTNAVGDAVIARALAAEVRAALP